MCCFLHVNLLFFELFCVEKLGLYWGLKRVGWLLISFLRGNVFLLQDLFSLYSFCYICL